METFWNTIASYNAATWPAQLALTLAAVVLTLPEAGASKHRLR